jgi:CheY-like chemotaxis protein
MPYSEDFSDRQQGTGLGLAITKNILLAMGSKIELNSIKDIGSEFYFNLHLRMNEQDNVKEQGDEIDYSGHFSSKRVLLVDDVQLNIEVAAFILEDVGFIVESATNGQEALDMFLAAPEGNYDIIIMDIQMPIMDGIETTIKLRGSKLPHAKTIPIIAMTANAFDDDLKSYIASGMDGCITKPIQVDEMLKLIKNLI